MSRPATVVIEDRVKTRNLEDANNHLHNKVAELQAENRELRDTISVLVKALRENHNDDVPSLVSKP
jgi:hypothetical protein